MRPAISYHASRLPLALANMSIVQKYEGDKAINFASKQDFIDHIDSKNTIPDADVHLVISCQCGKVYSYETPEHIPESNVVCECGRKVLIYGN